jgi:hypothetical protein
MRRLPATVLCALAAVLLAAPAPAGADVFGSIGLASEGLLSFPEGTSTQQADYARDPVVSGDGRYVAFDGSFDGLSGIWRRDLQTGQLRPVAVGRQLRGGRSGCSTTLSWEQADCDAELPSISEDGQYVSFTTSAPLAPKEDTNSAPDVYVRNMNLEASESESRSCGTAEEEDAPELTQRCAYTLASAVNGVDQGLTYERSAGLGSVAGGRSAMSANGQEVAFVTTAVSDLTDPQQPEAPSTPAMQVAVRNLASRETELVSTRLNPETGQAVPDEPVSGAEGSTTYGAAYGGAPSFPFAFSSYTSTQPFGASISADGSTVAWLGVNVGEQARTLSGEGAAAGYAEPLWRRIADGPDAPSRQVSGGSDPENPACRDSGETSLPQSPSPQDPCQGPFATRLSNKEQSLWNGNGGVGDPVPQLSADGHAVAFLATAPLVSLGIDFGANPETRHSDLYVADMHQTPEGKPLTRTEALTPLTELASGEESKLATNAPILDLAISRDGSQVAFTTKRTDFPLGSPTYISAATGEAGLAELFDVDLENQTLMRVTHGFTGGPGEHPHVEVNPGTDPYFNAGDGALAPSFSSNGNSLAFSSTASNLVYGDGNTPPQGEGSGPFDGSDAFVVNRTTFSFTPAAQDISSAPASPALTPPWSLSATASSQRDGSVLLYVQAPGAGALRASAQGAVVVRAAQLSRPHKSAHGTVRRVLTRAVVASRTVASSAHVLVSSAAAIVPLRLVLARSYRALASKPGGFSATVRVVFAAAGHPTLAQSIDITFLRPPAPARHKSKGKGRAASSPHTAAHRGSTGGARR